MSDVRESEQLPSTTTMSECPCPLPDCILITKMDSVNTEFGRARRHAWQTEDDGPLGPYAEGWGIGRRVAYQPPI